MDMPTSTTLEGKLVLKSLEDTIWLREIGLAQSRHELRREKYGKEAWYQDVKDTQASEMTENDLNARSNYHTSTIKSLASSIVEGAFNQPLLTELKVSVNADDNMVNFSIPSYLLGTGGSNEDPSVAKHVLKCLLTACSVKCAWISVHGGPSLRGAAISRSNS